ncbi:protein twisted gastrulation [Leptinotarsa decemlineata]|uniref:protein twisted gastrulation n=1 Tax=Leptinotarsa decemlineata TaxID=7539 RepID=UPI000C252847|nr:protein twisted gastrulation-like [Leptinotarsa decemlineata]
MVPKWVIFLTAFLGTFLTVHSCNEAVCGPVVSKCLLIQSCQCDLKNNRTCTAQCFTCLGSLYTECCNCLDMCPKTADDLAVVNKASNVEDIVEPVPQLFEALVETSDPLHTWTSEKIQVQFSIRKNNQLDGDGGIEHQMVSVNCSVAYWMNCMSYKKCRDACISMGASSFRFFHHGCCECVGSTCINYGISESKCQKCSIDDEPLTVDENDLDYGEEDYEE